MSLEGDCVTALEFVITLAKHLIYKKYFYVPPPPPNDLSEMLPLFIDRHCVRNKQTIILLCSINSYMLRDHICNAKCTNLECMCFHCTAALGREDLPCEFWNIFLFHDTMNSIRVPQDTIHITEDVDTS